MPFGFGKKKPGDIEAVRKAGVAAAKLGKIRAASAQLMILERMGNDFNLSKEQKRSIEEAAAEIKAAMGPSAPAERLDSRSGF